MPRFCLIRCLALIMLMLVGLGPGHPLPSLGAPPSRHALRFHGTGIGPPGHQDRVRIRIDDDLPGPDASAPCDLGRGDFTIEFWMRGFLANNTTSHAGGDREFWDFRWIDGNIIIDRDIWGPNDRDWGVSLSGGFIRFGTGRGEGAIDEQNTIEGNTPVLDGHWHHVALTRDATSGIKQIIVDGQLDMTSSPGASTEDISYPDDGVPYSVTEWGPYIVLGAEKHDAGPAYPSYNGWMDELRLWTRVRNVTEIQATLDLTTPPDRTGLVAHYPFEEGSGGIVMDISSAGSPPGELIAGLPGNGEWTSLDQGPLQVAPLLHLAIRRTPEGLIRLEFLTSISRQYAIRTSPSLPPTWSDPPDWSGPGPGGWRILPITSPAPATFYRLESSPRFPSQETGPR